MAIELALAEARKVFATTEDFRGPKPLQKLARVSRHFPRIRRHCARAQHAVGCLKCQIEHRREVDIETQRPAGLTDNFPMLAKKLMITSRERVRCRRRCSQRVAKSIDRSALQINAGKWRRGDAF